MHRYREQIGSYQRKIGLGEEKKWIKGVNCIVMDGTSTFAGEHTSQILMMYTCILSNIINRCHLNLKKREKGSHFGSAIKNLTGIPENAGSIPGPAQ